MRFEDFIYFNDDALSLDESNKIVNFVQQNRKTFELFSADQKQVTKYNRSKAKQDDFWFYVEMFGTFPKDLVNMMGDCLKEGVLKYCCDCFFDMVGGSGGFGLWTCRKLNSLMGVRWRDRDCLKYCSATSKFSDFFSM